MIKFTPENGMRTYIDEQLASLVFNMMIATTIENLKLFSPYKEEYQAIKED
jgi:hypothetical protein